MPRTKTPLLIRADATVRLGSGHVMRCLALAQAWQATRGPVTFLTAGLSPALRARLEAEGIAIRDTSAEPGSADDATEAAALAAELGAAWMVVDGYHFGADYQRIVKDAQRRLLFIDDNGHATHYCCDLVLNQNVHASESLYASREPETRLLLGTRYSLLRREFWPWRSWRRQVAPRAGKVLVTLGGSDPDNETLKVIRALGETGLREVEAMVLVGGDSPHYAELHAAVGESPTAIRLERNVTNVPELMAWADLAVSAGGGTCWELALMGLPSLVIVLAENQRMNSEALDARGTAVCLGWHAGLSSRSIAEKLRDLLASQDTRAAMSRKAREMVDGRGGRRVVDEMLMANSVRVRPASPEDIELLFEWANDPVTRRMGFHTHRIEWAEHQKWYNEVMRSSDITLLIVELGQNVGDWTPFAQVRFDGDGTVSLSLAKEFRGRHLSVPALKVAISFDRAAVGPRTLTAYVKQENVVSQKVFVNAGFESAGPDQVSGQSCLKYVLRPANEPG